MLAATNIFTEASTKVGLGQPAILTRSRSLIHLVQSANNIAARSVLSSLPLTAVEIEEARGYVQVQIALLIRLKNALQGQRVYSPEAKELIMAIMLHDNDLATKNIALHDKLNAAILDTLFPNLAKVLLVEAKTAGLAGCLRQIGLSLASQASLAAWSKPSQLETFIAEGIIEASRKACSKLA